MNAPIKSHQRQRMEAALSAQIRHLQRCWRKLRYVDNEVFEAGIDLRESETELALWLCEPAFSLNEKSPLNVIQSARGRKQVAHILRALAHGS